MLTKTVREALEAERVTLKAERDSLVADIDAKIAAIEVLLRAKDVPQRALPLPTPPSPGSGNTANTGLREAIRQLVLKQSGGMTKEAIMETLETAGFQSKGSTPFSTLVGTELWRLSKKEIRKIGDKYYPPAASAHQVA